ncbi:MAG TPA: hypothetical protein VGX70_13665 [Gemmataceae bacterium]|jgi:hypothetical protein|nr:hypothetical protein [Gemmataceae bacterium]
MPEIWIGLAHVKPRPANDLLEGSRGAFVNSVGLAENEQDFASALIDVLDKYDFDVVEMKDVEPLRNRELTYSVDSNLRELAAKLTWEDPIGLGSFHAYEEDE